VPDDADGARTIPPVTGAEYEGVLRDDELPKAWSLHRDPGGGPAVALPNSPRAATRVPTNAVNFSLERIMNVLRMWRQREAAGA
jgi:hypothetical protein